MYFRFGFAAILVLFLAGCSQPSGTANSVSEQQWSVTQPNVVQPAPVQPNVTQPNVAQQNKSVAPEPQTNSHGNYPMRFGQTFVHGGATMTIISATFDPSCTTTRPRVPENGHFLVLNVTATTSPAATEGPLNRFGFTWIDNKGQTMAAGPTTDATGYCFPQKDELPWAMGPGQSGAGIEVLDVNSVGGSLIYSPEVSGGPGYEWTITTG